MKTNWTVSGVSAGENYRYCPEGIALSDEEFYKKILYGDYLTSDQAAPSSARPNKAANPAKAEAPENDLDRLLAEIRSEFNLDPPDSQMKKQPSTGRQQGKPAGSGASKLQERPADSGARRKEPSAAVSRPQEKPAGSSAAGRLPEKPAGRFPEKPAGRPQEKPVGAIRQQEKPEGGAVSRTQERQGRSGANAPVNRAAASAVNRETDRPAIRAAHGSAEAMPPDSALSRELLDQMRVLTREVKLLRAQLQSDAGDPGTHQAAKPNRRNDGKRSTAMASKEKGRFWWLGEAVFYLVLVVVIVGAFLIKSNSGGRPTLIAGFSGFTVLTSSMEDTIPKGSLVITKAVDPKNLKIGDDITYMSGATSTITHRIIEIRENYMDSNIRAFITKGTMNKNPDKNPVVAANVVGKVVFHSKVLGAIAAFLSKNWPIVLFIMVILVGLFYVLKWIFNSSETPAKEQTGPPADTRTRNQGRYRR